MKKIVYLLVLVMLTIGVTGCKTPKDKPLDQYTEPGGINGR